LRVCGVLFDQWRGRGLVGAGDFKVRNFCPKRIVETLCIRAIQTVLGPNGLTGPSERGLGRFKPSHVTQEPLE
jgi:hypothetical protein